MIAGSQEFNATTTPGVEGTFYFRLASHEAHIIQALLECSTFLTNGYLAGASDKDG